ncbi:MAG: hypothetical protein KJ063_02430 [Anaerolineae bacterium]|nr:hypothetical protein [Anaerolineae bacterium]
MLLTDQPTPDGQQPTANGQQPTATDPGPVPYARFAEVNKQAKELEVQLATFQSQAKATEEKRLAEEAKWKELAEKREQELTELRNQLTAASLNQMRLQAASQHGIPADLAGRLIGNTLEELTADAQKMAAYLRPTTPGVPPVGSNRTGGASAPTPEQLRDPKWVRENKEKVLAANQR